MEALENLASYRRCVEQIGASWETFQARRREHLQERERYGHAAERATENILEDLFTSVLDWSLGDVNRQVQYADLLLTRLGVKHLIVEAKRPGSLAWSRRAVNQALEQARRYADEQKVRNVAVSDGHMIYAAEIVHGGFRDRCFASLVGDEPATEDGLLHPKYRLPAICFAYVGDASDPKTWHLPYLLADGKIDTRRLPKAVQAILTNYRGATVSSVPEADIPDVLVRLACAAATAGKMPGQIAEASPAYCQLADALAQMGRSNEVKPIGETADRKLA